MKKRELVLLITPALVGGSWIALKQLAEMPNKQFRYIVLGLGNYNVRHKNFTVINIPYFRYDSYAGHFASKYTILGIIYEIPLYLISSLFVLFLKPKIVICNGLITLIPLLPIVKLMKSKTILSFRGWFDEARFGKIKKFLQFCGKFIDLTFVNSKGTKVNFSAVIPKEKIIIIEHHAHRKFFQKRDRFKLRKEWKMNDKFVILYVGRIDEEKHCDFLIKLIKKLKNKKNILFLFVGEGRLKKEVINLEKKYGTVKYLGFIADVGKLSEIYSIADVVWSHADESYLSRPAVESLASGTPIIIPSIPAIGEKINKDVRISKSLFPQEVGWIVDLDISSAAHLILNIKDKKLALQKRKKCLEYAKQHYFKDNSLFLLEKLAQLSQF